MGLTISMHSPAIHDRTSSYTSLPESERMVLSVQGTFRKHCPTRCQQRIKTLYKQKIQHHLLPMSPYDDSEEKPSA